jgi:hypothetical protein
VGTNISSHYANQISEITRKSPHQAIIPAPANSTPPAKPPFRHLSHPIKSIHPAGKLSPSGWMKGVVRHG